LPSLANWRSRKAARWIHGIVRTLWMTAEEIARQRASASQPLAAAMR